MVILRTIAQPITRLLHPGLSTEFAILLKTLAHPSQKNG